MALAAWLALSSCAPPKVACGGSDAKYYDEALIFHLEKARVPYERSHGGGLCVDERYAQQLREAEREVERAFPQVAHLLRDECEERALAEWARQENLRFDVRQAYDASAERRPSGKLFLLRAFTVEEMRAYRDKLDRSPALGKTCVEN